MHEDNATCDKKDIRERAGTAAVNAVVTAAAVTAIVTAAAVAAVATAAAVTTAV